MPLTNNKFQIEQKSTYDGDDWWKWEIWIDGKDTDLDTIEHVVYTLHSTFVKPVRQLTNRESKFILKEEGWGTFTIYAKLFLKNKTSIQLQHDLILLYPDGEKLIEERNKSFEVKEYINETKKGIPKKIFLFLGIGLILAFLLFMWLNRSKNGNLSADANDDDARDSVSVSNSANTVSVDSSNNTYTDEKANYINDSLKISNNNLELTDYRGKKSIEINPRVTSFNYNIVYRNNGDTSLSNARDLIFKLLQNEINLIKSMDDDEFRKKFSIRSNRN